MAKPRVGRPFTARVSGKRNAARAGRANNMSSARGQANHALYLARILLAAWRRDLAAEAVATITLTQAFLPAVRLHLGHAYGWFLVEITRPGGLPVQPPQCVAELPEVADGKAVPGRTPGVSAPGGERLDWRNAFCGCAPKSNGKLGATWQSVHLHPGLTRLRFGLLSCKPCLIVWAILWTSTKPVVL